MGRKKAVPVRTAHALTVVGAAALASSSSPSPRRTASSDHLPPPPPPLPPPAAAAAIEGAGRVDAARSAVAASSPPRPSAAVRPATVTPEQEGRHPPSPRRRRRRRVTFAAAAADGGRDDDDDEETVEFGPIEGETSAHSGAKSRIADEDDGIGLEASGGGGGGGEAGRAKRRIVLEDEFEDEGDDEGEGGEVAKDDLAWDDDDEEVRAATTADGETVLSVRRSTVAAGDDGGAVSSLDGGTGGGATVLMRRRLTRTRLLTRGGRDGSEQPFDGAALLPVRTVRGIRTVLAHFSRHQSLGRDSSDAMGSAAREDRGEEEGATPNEFDSVVQAAGMGLMDVFLSPSSSPSISSPESPGPEIDAVDNNPSNAGHADNGCGGSASSPVAVLTVRLSPGAFSECSAESLPNSPPVPVPRRLPGSSTRDGTGGKMSSPHPAYVLRKALGELFPDSVVADVASDPAPGSSSSPSSFGAAANGGNSGVITAKMVYGVVDNTHAHEFEGDADGGGPAGGGEVDARDAGGSAGIGAEAAAAASSKKKPPPLIIPGLVPKLRPYQEAAVRWMLKREAKVDRNSDSVDTPSSGSGSGSSGREWELCWVVLVSPGYACGGGESIEDGKLVPLPQWREEHLRGKSGPDADITLYSPFTGWLASSYEEARCATLNIARTRFSHDPKRSDKYTKLAAQNDGVPVVKGGILAESMGLGKTVEVLACILANPCPTGQCSSSINGQDIGSENKSAIYDCNEMDAASSCIESETSISEVERRTDCGDAAEQYEMVESTKKDTSDNVASASCGGKRRKISAGAAKIDAVTYDFPGAVCICGRSGSYPTCLSWVVCGGCHEPMHGRCAGFESEEQILATTFESDLHHRVRLCSDDHCPSCVASRSGLLESRATLIVTPPAILSQWQREINRHTLLDGSGPLKVVVYPGVRNLCMPESSSHPNEQFNLIHAKNLANADIVLMTFQSLMVDLGHSNENPYATPLSNSGRAALRRRKKYRVVPSPLTSINWWRVCLDEAQRVEAPTASSARMALKLVSRHKWCVSGTPIGRGKLEDLFGLLVFLQLAPFNDKKYFRSCLQLSHRDTMMRISHLLRDALWRSTKSNQSVRAQMGVPEQVERKIHLRFSSIEKHFYERQLEETVIAADKLIKDDSCSKRAKSRDADMLSAALHKLRAACCHPQVGTSGIGRVNLRKKGRHGSHCADGVASRVLTMDQILDRLIDDAKTKCEEAQRIAVLHTNALACLSKLKVEAQGFADSDASFLLESCNTYLEALQMTDNNSSPSITVGEATLTGCTGFRSARKVVRDGLAVLDWQIKAPLHDVSDNKSKTSRTSLPFRSVWGRFDFEGPGKHISCIQVRCIRAIPQDLEAGNVGSSTWRILHPKDCVLQLSSAAVGGGFVDVRSFTFSKESSELYQWQTITGFRTNKSKSWRILIENYYEEDVLITKNLYVGIELQMMEPDIAADNLQRLHILHNASLSFTALMEQRHQEPGATSLKPTDTGDGTEEMSPSAVREKLTWMQAEAEKLESLYMEHARSIHRESQRQLREATRAREKCEFEFDTIAQRFFTSFKDLTSPQHGHQERSWWEYLLSWCYHGDVSQRRSLCDIVRRDLASFYENLNERSGALDPTIHMMMRKTRFPSFEDVDGLHIALSLRLQEGADCNHSRNDRAKCVATVSKLSPFPSDGELFENSHCKKCREDWHQTGPECRHCQLETRVVQHQRESNDPEMTCVFKSLWRWVKDQSGVSQRSASHSGTKHRSKDARHDNHAFLEALNEKISKFFELQGKIRAEVDSAKIAWGTHFNLLSDLDELNQSKRAMRLRRDDENLALLQEHELAFIVDAANIPSTVMDHKAKQAMAMATLRRNKDTLRYLKNQSLERRTESCRKGQGKGSTGGTDGKHIETCAVCLSSFQADRAVLSCGHSFHSSCLENLMARAGGGNTISCPMRCAIRTRKQDVLIASDKNKNDGSQSTREIEGDYGTKVNRLVGDILDTVDLGDKSLIFSQWEDMIDIICLALSANNVKYVRPKSGKIFGSFLKKFRDGDCSVLIMNVKNGAEGLTLVEANHVFMTEPLLNCGLDIQAINRIHRIGQTSKTFVHRYIMEDTIETKIDKLRMERQENHFEDDVQEQKKHDIRAGGIDGGFSQSELEELFS